MQHLVQHRGIDNSVDLKHLFPTVSIARTLQRDLKALLDKGLVTVEGATHQLRLSSSGPAT